MRLLEILILRELERIGEPLAPKQIKARLKDFGLSRDQMYAAIGKLCAAGRVWKLDGGAIEITNDGISFLRSLRIQLSDELIGLGRKDLVGAV